MPTTQERIAAMAANARQNAKGHAITLDLYVYPNGKGAVRAKGETGYRRALPSNNDDDLARIVRAIVGEIRDNADIT